METDIYKKVLEKKREFHRLAKSIGLRALN